MMVTFECLYFTTANQLWMCHSGVWRTQQSLLKRPPPLQSHTLGAATCATLRLTECYPLSVDIGLKCTVPNDNHLHSTAPPHKGPLQVAPHTPPSVSRGGALSLPV